MLITRWCSLRKETIRLLIETCAEEAEDDGKTQKRQAGKQNGSVERHGVLLMVNISRKRGRYESLKRDVPAGNVKVETFRRAQAAH